MTRRRRQKPHDGGKKTGEKGQPSALRRPASAVLRGWRLWAARAVLIFVGPAVFLGLLEGILLVCGAGYPTSFFVKSEQRGVLTTNVHFGWHYQQETLTEPEPCLVAVDKPKGTIRIFVLGESAAMGTPDPSFGFARILEVMLQSAFPNERFEVINAAMRGINSHVIVPIARECAGLAPDLFVIYMGNNELNGLYGPKTPVTFFGKHPGLIPAFHWLKQTRTAQLLRRVLKANPEAARTKRKPPTAEFFREHRTALDDPERDYVYRNFRRNLERICEYGLRGGAAVVLSTVAVNLRDCPPLGSLHRSDLTQPQLEEWERLYRKGMMSEVSSDTPQAISCYEQAAALDDHYAELHFRLARCQLLAGQRQAAWQHFVLARDWDSLQFRADTRLNDIVREIATQFSDGDRVRLVETEAALAAGEQCPDGIPGREFFYEHVHLRFDGDYEVAKALLPAVVRSLQERGLTVPEPPVPMLSREQCAKALAFTAWDEVNTAAAMVKLTAQPPFTGQLEHAARQAAAEKEVSTVMDRVDEAFIRQVIQAYREAIEARPQDWHLHYNLGTLLHQLERCQEAAAQFDYVVQTFPHRASFRVLLGYALGKTGRVDQAIEQFRQALKRDRRCKEAREGLAWARTTQRRARP
jgi:tetratricopeptide (TPR) repeat protein